MEENRRPERQDVNFDTKSAPLILTQLKNLEQLIAKRNDDFDDSAMRLHLLEDKVDRILDIVEGSDSPPLLTSINSLEKDVGQLRESVGWLRRIVYSVTAFLLVTLLEIFRETLILAH
ncbi:hypothetical protein [Thalassoroseus pseudoceratinae]|uniref:hypothetical protein n=1 Tax=Thalassoroseus pseudoceratinae TaxID=2713176 RepID=UPI00141E820C|nr:hypothetical protein [Thalassoroseus pseudoceratinae]